MKSFIKAKIKEQKSFLSQGQADKGNFSKSEIPNRKFSSKYDDQEFVADKKNKASDKSDIFRSVPKKGVLNLTRDSYRKIVLKNPNFKYSYLFNNSGIRISYAA